MEKDLKQIQIEQISTGPVSIKERRKKRQKTIVTEILADYASNSTLHGLRYMTARELPLCERIFWLTTFLVSISMCGYLINNVYVKWRTSPVIISVNERLVSVISVPFPSITICPQIKSKVSSYNVSGERYKMNDISAKNETLDPNAIEMYEDIRMLCGRDLMDGTYIERMLSTDRNYTNDTIIEKIQTVSPSAGDAIARCKMGNTNCIQMFKSVLTSEGVCFNFNGLAANELFTDSVQSEYNYTDSYESTRGWSFVNGYADSESDPYPRRGSENGARPDLEVRLYNLNGEKDVLCNGAKSGFKIYMSHPADLPQSSLHYYAAINGQLSSLAVSVHVMTTSGTLLGYGPEDRQCYFPKERELQYFKIYTVENCRAECLSNYTYQKCGCVGFYMPHYNSSRICTKKMLACMEGAKDYMASEELRRGADDMDGGCRCLPACYSVEYDAEVLKTEFKEIGIFNQYVRELFDTNDSLFDENTDQYAKIDVYFKKPEFVSMRRSEMFGKTDFIANIGGLLGVFLGFSFLSLVELIYFLTLRLGFTIKKDLKDEKKNLKHA